MFRNCLEKFSKIISPGAALLILLSQPFIFWLQHVDFSFWAEAWEENPTIRKQEATKMATRPGSIQFLFFISVGFVI
jgi:hypothetical protein